MLIAFVVIGWLLFAGTALLYYVGNRINARDEAALGMFALAVLLSDSFRNLILEGYEKSIRESKDLELKQVMWGMYKAVGATSKRHYSQDSPLHLATIVEAEIDQRRK